MKTMHMNRRAFLKAALAGAVAVGSIGLPALPAGAQGNTIVDVAVGASTFKTLVAAVQAAGLVETLSGPGPFTVFAPTDEAFAKLPAGTIDNLLKPENKDQLVAILTYHVVPGNVKAADVVNLTSAKTVNGAEIKITVSGGSVKVNDANVIQTDIAASNGVIHVIDAVLLPPAAPTPVLPPTGAALQAAKDIVDTAIAAGNFTTLVAALEAAGLTNTLKRGNYSVFAPTDEAFAKLPPGTVEELLKPENKKQLTDILLYHVVRGRFNSRVLSRIAPPRTLEGQRLQINPAPGNITVDGASIVQADIAATNGFIHVIDTVLMPPGDIVATAVSAGNFKTLAAALEAAGLVETLKGRGPFTVFAPTDEAFAKLPPGTLDELLKPENKKQLTDILLYHVARGNLPAATVTRHGSVPTLGGKRINVKVDGSNVMLNDADVVATDVRARNGIIHVIDAVLLP